MNSKIEKPELKEDTYPCLKESKETGNIVLFTSPSSGISIFPESESKYGRYSNMWKESNFELFNGKITLSN